MKTSALVAIAFIFLIIAACTPSFTTPPPATPQAPMLTTVTAPIKASPALSPEEVAWAKVVEAAKKEGKITHYATWSPQANEAIVQAFKSRYGIDVEMISGRGAEFTERLKTERRIGQRVGDVLNSDIVLVNNMKLEGLLASVADELPVLREKGVWGVEPTVSDPQDKANLTYKVTERASYINPKLVKPGEIPKTWKDLLGPRWTGNMALSDPNIIASFYQVMVVFFENKVWDEDYIRALYRQKLRMTANDPDGLRLLAAGEVHLTINSSDAFTAIFAQEGAPIQAIAIEDAVIVTPVSLAALAGAPHTNATRVYMNWLLSAEGQSVVGKALGNKMVRKDVPDFRPKSAQAPATKYFMVSLEQNDKATQLFRQKWFDKLVGR